GGMAEVYRARDLALGREVAVKVLPASLATDPGYVERFRDEARRVATLDHPNVVPVYHYGEEHGLLYLVMPILKESLRDRMAREGVLAPSEAGRIVVQVAAALDAAHNHGIVHRDVKPENVLLNAEGKAHLTDFGISREMEFLRKTGNARTLAASGLPVGTPEYMAPEQLRGGEVDQRADIYALGAVLYELLTGTVPFDGPTPYEVASLVLTAPLAPPSVRNDAIWPDLDHVVMKALDRDAAARYPDARSLAIGLRDAVLHRDEKMTRVTIPASTYLQRAVAAQGAVLTLPTSGSLEKLGAPFIAPQLNLPSTVTGDTPTESTAPFTVAGGNGKEKKERWARSGLVPRRRTWMFVVASVLLVVLLIGAGWSVGILQGLLTSSGATSLPGIGGLIATDTPDANATATANAFGTASATTPSPHATATLPLAISTSIPQPTATATTAPPPALMYGAPSIPKKPQNGTCTVTQTITNPGSQPVSWQWSSFNPAPSSFDYWSVNGGSRVFGGLPSHTIAANTPSETVSFTFSSCKSGQAYTVTMTDNIGGNKQFTIKAP
ncbi:MAG: serine/threonine-protein kinase, partial [Ktedonobacterales bacterium]